MPGLDIGEREGAVSGCLHILAAWQEMVTRVWCSW
jgi:hypothetical protein